MTVLRRWFVGLGIIVAWGVVLLGLVWLSDHWKWLNAPAPRWLAAVILVVLAVTVPYVIGTEMERKNDA